MAEFDAAALKERYRIEREKRLRPDGPTQYQRLTSRFSDSRYDPYLPVVPRDLVTDDVTVAVLGGGFAGLLTGARLAEAGVERVRILDKAGDFGGTWYWNRYPGAQCDTAAMVYLPLLEETGHMPSLKYVYGPEIYEQCQRIGKHFGLYDHALFHTEVTSLVWDEGRARWIVETDRGDRFTAQFVTMGAGVLHVPKLPGIPGIDDFRGKVFHTSLWDYDYTGGDPTGAPMTHLADKRVGIIGTGATAVQCIPHLSRAAGELFVFQRTPSSVDERNNHPIDPDWFAEVSATPGWQQRWLENFTSNTGGGFATEDLVMDGWTELAQRIMARITSLQGEVTPERVMEAVEAADFEKMEEIRGRIDRIVHDRRTAEALKPWYQQLCKRPCFHDEYLQSFNNPNTHLVDTDGKGVERLTEDAVVVGGEHYALDCVIFATGFDTASDLASRVGADPVGRGGVRLSEHWAGGMRTLHGMHVHGFPNLFLVQLGHGPNVGANVPHNYVEISRTVAATVSHALDRGARTVDAALEAETRWMELISDAAIGGLAAAVGSAECTPGYYNNEGHPESGTFAGNIRKGHPGGTIAFFQHLRDWAAAGFDGLEVS